MVGTHNVYIVELDKSVLRHKKVQKLNPKAKSYLPPLYVGMTGLTPEQRFAKHKEGLKANSWVQKYGLNLRPELYKGLSNLKFQEAEDKEEQIAKKLRAKGYTVLGGNPQMRKLGSDSLEQKTPHKAGVFGSGWLNSLYSDSKSLDGHMSQADFLKKFPHWTKKADWTEYDEKRKREELPEQQARVVKKIQERGTNGLVLFHGMGSGKAEVVTNQIFTPTGTAAIGALKIGDYVIADDGNPTKVIGVFPQGLKDVYKVTFRDEVSIECCGEHLWLTTTHKERKNYNRSKPEFKSSWSGKVRNTLQIKDTLVDKNSLNHTIPTVKPINFVEQDLCIDPYLLGLLLGDGGLTTKSISFTSADGEIISSIRDVLNDDVEIKKVKNSKYGYNLSKKEGYRNSLRTTLRELGILGRGADDKHVPENYKFNSVYNRVAILQGLMDTDGTVGKSGMSVSFTSVSKKLAEDVLFLVQSLGGTGVIRNRNTKYTYKGVKKNGKRSYTVHISMPPAINPFRLSRKASRVKSRTKYTPTRYIQNVEYVGQKECICIAVENPNHLYVTEHFIVTHNTRASLEAYKALGMPADVIVPAALQENYKKESRKWLGNVPSNINIVSQQRLANPKLKTPLNDNGLQIVDEAQKAKNNKGELYQMLAKTNPKKRLLLSGTPMLNNPAELGNLVNLAAGTQVLPNNIADFKAKYFKPHEVQPGLLGRLTGVQPGIEYKLQHKNELKHILDKYVDYYKPTQEGYPTVNEEVVKVPMGEKQQDLYNSILGKTKFWTRYKVKHNLPPGRGELESMRAFLSGPRQVSNSTSGFTTKIRDVEAPKINAAFKFLQAKLNEDPTYKGLVYSNYLNNGIQPYGELLKKHNIPYGEFSGNMSPTLRNKAVQDYNANKIRALLVSGAGAEGLDLKGTRLEQLLDPHWNLAKERQVIGRGARFHSHDDLPPEKQNVLVQRYFAEPKANLLDRLSFNSRPTGTDEYIHNMAKRKDQMNQEIVDLIDKEHQSRSWFPSE